MALRSRRGVRGQEEAVNRLPILCGQTYAVRSRRPLGGTTLHKQYYMGERGEGSTKGPGHGVRTSMCKGGMHNVPQQERVGANRIPNMEPHTTLVLRAALLLSGQHVHAFGGESRRRASGTTYAQRERRPKRQINSNSFGTSRRRGARMHANPLLQPLSMFASKERKKQEEKRQLRRRMKPRGWH